MNQLTQPTTPNNRSLIRILSALCDLCARKRVPGLRDVSNLFPKKNKSPVYLPVLCGLCVSFLLTPAHADDTLFDNYGSYVNIEHQEGLDIDRVLIINHGRVFIGDVDENGYFNAYGINGSVWGSQTGAGQVIVVPSFTDEVE